jgi:Eukaryotic-type carbonic anhydrase
VQSGFEEKYPYAFFQLPTESQCKWCPAVESNDACGQHRQSPIDLLRDRGIIGNENEKECPDWHWMQSRDDSCSWDDVKDHFSIQRHALQMEIPQLPNGDIDCIEDGKRKYPRIDYSKGFPHWWWMQRIDIMVPSQHTQEGTQYAAEVILAHFYEQVDYKNKVRCRLKNPRL